MQYHRLWAPLHNLKISFRRFMLAHKAACRSWFVGSERIISGRTSYEGLMKMYKTLFFSITYVCLFWLLLFFTRSSNETLEEHPGPTFSPYFESQNMTVSRDEGWQPVEYIIYIQIIKLIPSASICYSD